MQLTFTKLPFLIIAFSLLPVFCLATETFPVFPMAFWGNASVDNDLLPAGAIIKAYCDNNLVGEITMIEDGIYGYTEATKNKLLVSNCDSDILFKYLPQGVEEDTTGGVEIKYTEGFVSETTVNKDLNFINTRSCSISNGQGIQTWGGSGWGDCALVGCNSGYHQSGNSCVADASGGGSGGGGDATAPTISQIEATTTATGITITWKTNESSISWVIYGTSTDYGLEVKTAIYTTSHSISLSDLSPGTTYHYQIKSKDSAGNIGTYTDKSFTITEKSGGGKVADINNDSKIDKYDFALMMAAWGKTGTHSSDLNGDNKVDKYDFALLMANWGVE